MSDTVVFLGPTLPLAKAQAILPDAHYHAPVECGDILRIMRLQPKCLVIIDGLYERHAAVWHKEILCALDAGISVVGASSMGALRAAELHTFGMLGLGEIFAGFKNAQLTDDDEVAVLHGPRASGFAPLNEAMVSIRATVTKACSENIITAAEADEIIQAAKALHYSQRSIQRACSTLQADYNEFLQWTSEHFINQKECDAILALEFVRQNPSLPTATPGVSKTIFLRNLLYYANTTPFNQPYEFLPPEEHALLRRVSEQPNTYHMLQELAYLLAIAYDLAQSITPTAATSDLLRTVEHYLNAPPLTSVHAFMRSRVTSAEIVEADIAPFVRWTRFIFTKKGCEDEAVFDAFVAQYALLWFCLDSLTVQLELHVHVDDIEAKTTRFMQKNQLESLEALEQFIAPDLNMDELNDMLLATAYLEIIFKDKNYDFLLTEKNLDVISWLCYAKFALQS